MKTKLVYVLTCAPQATYIEQALMSVWSARHWNPDAHIVLITDNLTDNLLVGKRGEILDYISEKIVVPFEDDSLSMTYRSRWLKTSVRQLIDGDFLFIDCDTIVCRSLSEIDAFECEVGAVPESMLPISEFCQSLLEMDRSRCAKIGVDLMNEQYYFCSGVMYVRDTENAHRLYNAWRSNWIESASMGLMADQPALCKADIALGHVILRIPDSYDLITFTQDRLMRDAHIIHISSYKCASFLFSDKVLKFVKSWGLHNEWLKEAILHSEYTFFPFNNEVYSSSAKDRRLWARQMTKYAKGYGQFIDSSFSDLNVPSRLHGLIHSCFVRKQYRLGLWLWLTWCYFHLHLTHFQNYENICQKS